MSKPTISVVVRPPQNLVSRQAEAFTSTPSEWTRGWIPDDCEISTRSGAVFLKHNWKRSTYAYGLDDYQRYPDDDTAWVESGDALGQGDKAIGFCSNSTYAATTAWVAHLDTTHVIGRNRGVLMSFIWYRPASTTTAYLNIYPRLDHTRYTDAYGARIYFTPFMLTIDQNMKLSVYEYPYDNYDYFITNPAAALQKQCSYNLVVTPEALASRWHSIEFIAMSDDDVLVSSDIIEGGGFLFRSAMDRQNIYMLPEGIAGIQSTVGGTGQVQILPLETESTGSIKSSIFSKAASNSVYPSLSVFGWSPSLINTDRGFMSNQAIDSGATGTGGIRYNIYSVVKSNGVETETLVDPSGGVEFKDFKVEVILTPTENVSPVINDLIVDYDGSTSTVADPTTDISNDVMDLSGQVSDDGNVRFNMKIRNPDATYNAMAERICNEVNVDIDGEDFAVLYTLNPQYDWFAVPNKGALELEWEMGDGMVYLQRELCARHPAYDGQLLSACLTEFMGRLGYDASRLDIDTTDGTIGGRKITLPKKMGKDGYQFKPEDGTPAEDFIKKLKEWFGSTHTCRFSQDGKFEFKYIPVDSTGMEIPTIARTYYSLSTEKPTADDHVIYRDAKVELFMDNFYNEIWVVGEDKRNNKPLIAMYQDPASQSDKNSPNYVGRRLLMIVLTKLNTLSAVTDVCNQLKAFYGRFGVRLQFTTRLDPAIQKDDFIKVYGVAATWRITDIDYGISLNTVANSTINSETAAIKGMKVTCTQWPVVQ